MTPIQLQVVTVTNNLEEYPHLTYDTRRFPHLVAYIGDEVETFIVGEDGFWRHQDFFLLGDIKRFTVTEGHIE